jgi:deazaflavin-dependent oxidoreductase (nitroreductase family)
MRAQRGAPLGVLLSSAGGLNEIGNHSPAPGVGLDGVSTNSFNEFNRRLMEDLRAHQGRATSGPFAGRELLILTTRGAKSGETRQNPLAFTRAGDGYVIVASKGGAPTNPDWYHNLVSSPEVAVEVHGGSFKARARVTEGAERDRLFKAHADLMPGFWEYQKNTTRTIPVVVLDRVD